MKIVSHRTLIRKVAERWRAQYGNAKGNKPPGCDEIQRRLDALNVATATVKDVSEIIGNSSWVRLKCDECEREVEAVIVLGQEPDYESHTAAVCQTCIDEAHLTFTTRLIESAEVGDEIINKIQP